MSFLRVLFTKSKLTIVTATVFLIVIMYNTIRLGFSLTHSSKNKYIKRSLSVGSIFQMQQSRLDFLSEFYKVKEVNCGDIFEDSDNEELISNAMNVARNFTAKNPPLCSYFYINATNNCADFVESRGYIFSSLSELEYNFPVAYAISVYTDIEMAERLLRSIYRPHNYYCIHVDIKASDEFFTAVESIAGCFHNVVLPYKRLNVTWGAFSVLESNLVCMEALWSFKRWKYFINLTGQELPLKTNYEIVKILTALNGANDVDSSHKQHLGRLRGTTPPPGIIPHKGETHVIINRKFVDFVLHNVTSQRIQNWLRKVRIPDEWFYNTLNNNPQLGIPGSYKGDFETKNNKPYLARFKNWLTYVWYCYGGYVRQLCIFATGDLSLLRNRRELFANKFHISKDRLVIGCMEELIFNRTRDAILGLSTFDASEYEQFDFVQNQVFTPETLRIHQQRERENNDGFFDNDADSDTPADTIQ